MSQANSKHPTGFEGAAYDLTDHEAAGRTTTISHMPFGRAVFQDTDYDNGIVMGDADDILGGETRRGMFLGISMYERQFQHARFKSTLDYPLGHSATDNNFVEHKDTVSVGTVGRFYVRATTDVKPGDPVYIRVKAVPGSDLTNTLSTFTNAVPAEDTEVLLLEGAKWFGHSVNAGEMGVIALPHNAVATAV